MVQADDNMLARRVYITGTSWKPSSDRDRKAGRGDSYHCDPECSWLTRSGDEHVRERSLSTVFGSARTPCGHCWPFDPEEAPRYKCPNCDREKVTTTEGPIYCPEIDCLLDDTEMAPVETNR